MLRAGGATARDRRALAAPRHPALNYFENIRTRAQNPDNLTFTFPIGVQLANMALQLFRQCAVGCASTEALIDFRIKIQFQYSYYREYKTLIK